MKGVLQACWKLPSQNLGSIIMTGVLIWNKMHSEISISFWVWIFALGGRSCDSYKGFVL